MKLPVTKLADLANVKLSEIQKKELESSISSVISFMEEIKNLDLENVKETSRVSEEENIFREDVVEASFTQEVALKNAKKTYNGFFLVPYVFEKEES